MTAIVMTFADKNGLEQASSAAASRGLNCHAFPHGLTCRHNYDSFYRKWLTRNLPAVLPAHSVMVVPMSPSAEAPSVLCDLAMAVSQPDGVTGYLICDE